MYLLCPHFTLLFLWINFYSISVCCLYVR